MKQSWKLRVSTFFFPNFGVNTCPNFGIKMIFFQNSYLFVYHVATVLFWDIRVTPNFLVWVLYNISTVSFPTYLALLLSPSFSSKSQQTTPPSPKLEHRKSSAPSSSYSSGLPQIHICLDGNGDLQPHPRGMLSSSHSQNVGCYPVFPLSSNFLSYF